MIAYFCAEFALDTHLKIFAGGLGILAGDTIREAGDEGKDLIGIGLYYYKGYLSAEYDWYPPESSHLTLVTDVSGQPLLVTVPVEERDVMVRVWRYSYKSVSVYLLDTMLHHNHPDDQKISHYLYDQDVRIRLAQQLILGIGGVRLLAVLGIKPTVFHMNEGHSAFLALEKPAETTIVFTNHTVVPAGNHMYENALVARMFHRYAKEKPDFDLTGMIGQGSCQYPDTFSLSLFAMRHAKLCNGVSELHSAKLRLQYPDMQISNVTNGVHIPSWDQVGESDLTGTHETNKRRLIETIGQKTGTIWTPDMLILGWARRLVQYKRPLAFFEDTLRLYDILTHTAQPVRLVIAGIPHPRDPWANEALAKILALITDKFQHLIVYLPGYEPELARTLVSGVDVWANTPQVGLEACGTSGMKAALNGTLSLTTADGWAAEIDIDTIGWRLDDAQIADSLYGMIEQQIVPTFQRRTENVSEWVNKMHASRQLIRERFSAARMLSEYERKMWS